MLNSFRYNKSKRNVIEFFKDYDANLTIVEKTGSILKIEFSSISKVDLIKVSNKLIKTFESNIVDLEVVFCDNLEMSIDIKIIIALKSKLPLRYNLVDTGVIYSNLIEYNVNQKYGTTHEDEKGGLILASNIGNYYLYKLKVQ